jgi:signal transduction histidine kinase
MVKNDPAKTDHMLDLVEKSLSRAVDMIEDLRENSRLIKPNRVPVDLPGLVEETVKDMPMREGVSCEHDFGDNLNPVWIDPTLIRRVLENLLSNALEAMPDGGSLKLSARREGDEVLISVADSGVGIREDAAKKIFTHLYTTKSKGIGLGLSFCKRAVEAHNGTIGFTSKLGEGTTFTVRLPTR